MADINKIVNRPSAENTKGGIDKKGEMETSKSDIEKELMETMHELDRIYGSKSSDEYRMAGDITKSPVYDEIESQLANLSTLKNYPKKDAQAYGNMFNSLHKPLYKKMVTEFIKKPNEKNITFTAIFTAGYRLLVADLAMIYASTEATENGIVFVPGKMTPNAHNREFINSYNQNMEDEYNKALRAFGKKPHMQVQQEAALMGAIGSAATALAAFVQAHELIPITAFFRDVFDKIFGARKDLNPVSFINHKLTQSYDRQVEEFKSVQKLYEANKEAYEEYKASPHRRMLVEARYIKNIKLYNIKMKNLQAKLKHFDSRAMAEAEEKAAKMRAQKMEERRKEREQRKAERDKAKPAPNPNTKPTPSNDTPSEPKEEPPKQTTEAPKPKPKPVDTGDFDF